jgi:hypothetical protein
MTTNIILDIEMNVDLETLSAVRVYKLTENNLKEQLKVQRVVFNGGLLKCVSLEERI